MIEYTELYVYIGATISSKNQGAYAFTFEDEKRRQVHFKPVSFHVKSKITYHYLFLQAILEILKMFEKQNLQALNLNLSIFCYDDDIVNEWDFYKESSTLPDKINDISIWKKIIILFENNEHISLNIFGKSSQLSAMTKIERKRI